MHNNLLLLFSPIENSFEQEMFCHRVDVFHQHCRFNVPMVLVGAGCIALFLWLAKISSFTLIAWLLALSIVVTAMIICDRLYDPQEKYPQIRGWLKLRFFIGICSTSLYGLSPFLIPSGAELYLIVCMFTIIIFIWCMSLLSMTTFPEYYLIYTAGLLLPMAVYLQYYDQQATSLFLLLLCIAVMVALPKAFSLSQTAIREISHRLLLKHEIEDHLSARNQLTKHAIYDELTGLYNTRLFTESAQIIIANASRIRKRVGLIMLDVDNFSTICNQVGTKQADLVLQLTADRLINNIRESDIPARIGGDRFAVLIANLDNEEQLEKLIDSLSEKLAEPILLTHQQLSIQVSFGSAISPDDDCDIKRLLLSAQQRMNQIKRVRHRRSTGNNSYDSDS